MLGTRNPQRGLFEADHQYRGWVGEDTFYGWLAKQRGRLFRDEDFAGLYCATNGRPSVPPSVLATALVLQHYDGVSDEEARDRAKYDLRWKVALGIEVEVQPYAKSTFQEFRAQLIVHDEQAAIFTRSLEWARQQGAFKAHQQLHIALDTTPILGRGAVKDTWNLLGDGIAMVLRALAEQAGDSVERLAEREQLARYVTAPSLKGAAHIDWEDAGQRQQFLRQVVADADRVLALVRAQREQLAGIIEHEPSSDEERRQAQAHDGALATAAGLLSRVLGQDIARTGDRPAIARGVSRDRMPSVHDPDMRHGRKSKAKRFDGHKLQLAVDTGSQLVVAVDVVPGNAPDQQDALALVALSEATTGCTVAETIGDCAYGAGETRQAFAEAERELVAKVPACTNQGRYPKTAFDIDPQAGTCVCPAKQVSTRVHHFRKGGGQFVFAASVCAPCPLRPRCVRGSGGRTVQLHAQEALLQQARRLQTSPPFREYQRQRQVVEHTIARLVQRGIRQARYRGIPKTLFQALLAAAVVNLTLLAGHPDLFTVAVSGVWLLLAACYGLFGASRGTAARIGIMSRCSSGLTSCLPVALKYPVPG